MGNRDYRTGPRHGASSGKRSPARRASAGSGAGRPRREPLRDNYYYEQPPRGWQEGDAFQDISSYSSPAKRRADQRAMEEERRSAKGRGGKAASQGRSARSSRDGRDIYSSSHPHKGRKRKKLRAAKVVLTLLLVLVLAVGGSLVYMLSGLTMTSFPVDAQALGTANAYCTDGQIVNIALFGLDSRENADQGRADVTMVLSVDKRHHTLKLTSILRDSEVQIEGYGADKITHAYAYGGPELAIKTLNQNFHLDIEDYVTVNFFQMAEIVDAFGGIDMDLTAAEADQVNENLWTLEQENPGTVTYGDYIPSLDGTVQLVYGEYQDGTYHLTGNAAVAYARIRHLDSDDVRASRQQRVLEALLSQLKKKNIFQYPALIRKISTMCETSLDVGGLLGLAPILLGGLHLETLTIPGEEEQAYGAYLDDGSWVYEYDLEAAAQHINRFIYQEESPYYTGAE